jgi:cleavage and polyadenylation specificity factor subunit 3
MTFFKKHLLNDSPQEITTMAGQRVKVNCAVEYISFSAHTDYKQTLQFIRALKPAHIILVHGEATEMGKLKDALIRECEKSDYNIQVYNPKNTQPVELYFRGEKSAKVIGKLASNAQPKVDEEVSGILVKRNFKYHIISPEDLPNYYDLAVSTVFQRQSVPYKGDQEALAAAMLKNFGNFKRSTSTDGQNSTIRVLDAIDLIFNENFVILEVKCSFSNILNGLYFLYFHFTYLSGQVHQLTTSMLIVYWQQFSKQKLNLQMNQYRNKISSPSLSLTWKDLSSKTT